MRHFLVLCVTGLALSACGEMAEGENAVTVADAGSEPAQGVDEGATTQREDETVGEVQNQQTGEDETGLPLHDIHLANLTWLDGTPQIGNPVPVTQTGLYDNQPAFDADGFYFTTEGGDGTTDIRYFTLDGGYTSAIINTPEIGEFSARPTPDGRAITFIHQAPGDEGGQVWRLSLDGSSYGPVHGYGPAGYYALSGDGTQMLLFALTDPFTLLWVDLENGVEEELTQNIGRALYTSPDGQSAYFTLQNEDGSWQVSSFSFEDGTISALFDLPGTSQDYAVFTTPMNDVGWLSAAENELYYRTHATGWQVVGDLSGLGLNGVTRLAISPDASHIAFVTQE